MLLTVKLGSQYLPLRAPLGAAAVCVNVSDTTASVIFAMQQKGETGADTLNRVINRKDNMAWRAVAARPEEQRPAPYAGFDFSSFEFVYESGRWTPATKEVADFMNAISSLQTMPSVPPKGLQYTFGPAKSKLVRAS